MIAPGLIHVDANGPDTADTPAMPPEIPSPRPASALSVPPSAVDAE